MAARIATWLTDRFGLDLPVVTASMAGVADGAFAAAATRSGILGTIGAGNSVTPEWIAEQAATAAAAGPYGIGLMAWAQEQNPGQLDAVIEAGPDVVSMSLGDFASYIPRLRDAGITVLTQVGNVEQALRAEDAGADVVVARGGEGGGHGRNDVATLPLLQAVLERVRVPVLAAGGIGTARGLAAVLAAGAAGAWMGTAFTCCRESMWPDDQVARVQETGQTGTVYGRVFDVASAVGWPDDLGGRAIRNSFFDEWEGREDALPADDAAVRRFRRAPDVRDFDTMPVYVGQGVGLLPPGRPSIAEVVAELAEAAEQLRRVAVRLSD